ncbi:MAG: D-glycero-alpha-D-manno-heptose-1,7-bisphosphate 7-phosphatase [Bacillota bacterium]
MKRKRPAVFLDRDGTISEEIGHINDPAVLKLLPRAAWAVKKLNEHRIPAILISNQSGVARGYYGLNKVEEVMTRLEELLGSEGARLDKIYYCPHLPEGAVSQYAIECGCRKPKTGMMEKAAGEFGLDLKRCYMVGDKIIDMEAGRNIGGKTVLVMTGYGRKQWTDRSLWAGFRPDYTAEDLMDAVEWILRDMGLATNGILRGEGDGGQRFD